MRDSLETLIQLGLKDMPGPKKTHVRAQNHVYLQVKSMEFIGNPIVLCDKPTDVQPNKGISSEWRAPLPAPFLSIMKEGGSHRAQLTQQLNKQEKNSIRQAKRKVPNESGCECSRHTPSVQCSAAPHATESASACYECAPRARRHNMGDWRHFL